MILYLANAGHVQAATIRLSWIPTTHTCAKVELLDYREAKNWKRKEKKNNQAVYLTEITEKPHTKQKRPQGKYVRRRPGFPIIIQKIIAKKKTQASSRISFSGPSLSFSTGQLFFQPEYNPSSHVVEVRATNSGALQAAEQARMAPPFAVARIGSRFKAWGFRLFVKLTVVAHRCCIKSLFPCL